jgi:hypothetical protein
MTVYARELPTEEMYAVPIPPDEMVWEMCCFMNSLMLNGSSSCRHCRFGDQGVVDGLRMSQLCHVVASDGCRVVLAMSKRAAVKHGH